MRGAEAVVSRPQQCFPCPHAACAARGSQQPFSVEDGAESGQGPEVIDRGAPVLAEMGRAVAEEEEFLLQFVARC